jgi:hypothetical protein
MDYENCPYCGREVSDLTPDYCETPQGMAHKDCYDEAQRNDENDDYDDTAFWHDISHER